MYLRIRREKNCSLETKVKYNDNFSCNKQVYKTVESKTKIVKQKTIIALFVSNYMSNLSIYRSNLSILPI